MNINKYLVNVIVPCIEMNFDMYIPNNKKIGTIKKIIVSSINELSGNTFNKSENEILFEDLDSSEQYDNNSLVKDTNIKNGTKIIIL